MLKRKSITTTPKEHALFRIIILSALYLCANTLAFAAESVIIGLTYPRTGAYKEEGLAQMRGALMAIEEINAQGGLLGHSVQLNSRDSSARPEKAANNVDQFIRDGAAMVFGSVSSAEAVAAGKRAQQGKTIYFATIGYADDVTVENGHKYIFRESSSATMTGQALGRYLSKHFPNKKYAYITADYSWGHSAESAIRANTNTTDTGKHTRILVPFPSSKQSDFIDALTQVQHSDAQVLALVLYGKDLVRAMRIAHSMGLTKKMQIVVPHLIQTAIEGAGPGAMEGVIGVEHWIWRAPELEKSEKGMAFVKNFDNKYGILPSSAAASAYTVVQQWADAARRSNSFKSSDVIRALEDHEYSLLKDKAQWRAFDHQNSQTVYVVRANQRDVVMKHPSRQDFYEILDRVTTANTGISYENWTELRRKASLPTSLQ